jgi:ribosome maturation factor RimP
MRGQSGRNGQRPAPADATALSGVLRPVVEALGADLEEVRVTSAGRRRLIRVVIDADGGVSLDDITKISQQVCSTLDSVPGLGEAPYTVEVSSPGVDRPLTEPRHWRRAAGRLVIVPVAAADAAGGAADGNGDPAAGRPGSRGAPIQGRVASADASGVTIEVDGVRRTFRYAELGPGRVQVEFGRPGELQDEEELDGY